MGLNPIKLLIADDNRNVCNILQDYFRNLKEIQLCGIAFNGKEALEMIQTYRPDVVLLDLIMPEQDGLSVLEGLNKLQFKSDFFFFRPVVIITSAIESETITQKALQMGADYYLIKPYHMDYLKERILMIMGVNGDTDSFFTDSSEGESNLSSTIRRHLIEIGMPTHVIGYHYCIQAIETLLTESCYVPLMKYTYPLIAERNRTTVSCVESAIRTAIASIHDCGLNTLSNRSFLSRMTEQIRLKNQFISSDPRKDHLPS